jgi:formamidopyrimidine-DNA glycosylase
MPELPEVESLRLYLVETGIIGRTIVAVDADWPGIENTADGMGGLSGLPGRQITGTHRIGKNLLLRLDRGVLRLHMGMTGRLAVMRPEEARLKYTRVTFFLDDERRIELDDPRRWAGVNLEESEDGLFSGLGPDALDGALTLEEFNNRVGRRRSPIKSLLMDQSVLAGVGNIYADEALFRAHIRPTRRASSLSADEMALLHLNVRTVLLHALRFIVDHPDEHGRPYVVDAYDARMRLPRKKGSACPVCGTTLETQKFGGRTAYFCPQCQK